LARTVGRLLVGVVLAAGAVFYILALWKVPDLMHLRKAQDRYNSRVLVISAGGAVVVAIGLLYTARNYRLSHRGQVTDRFTKALERLGSDELYVRIGGVHALEHVMRDSADHHHDAVEVLSAFIRRRAPKRRRPNDIGRWMHPVTGSDADISTELPDVPDADIQAALTALANRPVRPERESISLAGLHLAGASLRRCDLIGADLRETNLSHAQLDGVDLGIARLDGADLRSARLDGADLRSAQLDGAGLRGAELWDADLEYASLRRADLRSAILPWANLTGAHFEWANLEGARLDGANLSYAHLGRPDVSSIVLSMSLEDWLRSGANLTGASLGGANLTGAKLDGAVLSGVRFGRAEMFTGRNRDSWRDQFSRKPRLTDLTDAELGRNPQIVPEGWTITDPATGRLQRDSAAGSLGGDDITRTIRKSQK
jgi:uncharacterized protein YjbI with pentapeptide repeats